MHLIPKDDPPPSVAPSSQPVSAAPAAQQPIVVHVPAQSGGGGGTKLAILAGVVVALLAASIYLFVQIGQVRTELASMKEGLLDEISKLRETSTVSTQTSRHSVDQLNKDLDAARAAARQAAGQAKVDAEKHAEELASSLKTAQEEQGKRVAAVSAEVSQVKDDTNTAKARIGEVSTEVAGVKTQAASTRADLEKTIADLKSAKGDLGVQSGLIATNGKELAALKELGTRNYTEFKIAKAKLPQKVGDVQVLLKAADPKRNRYTIELIADDKRVEKRDKTVNEPVQFILSRATIPYELVVNDIKKDVITGYLSAPKVQQSRGQSP